MPILAVFDFRAKENYAWKKYNFNLTRFPIYQHTNRLMIKAYLAFEKNHWICKLHYSLSDWTQKCLISPNKKVKISIASPFKRYKNWNLAFKQQLSSNLSVCPNLANLIIKNWQAQKSGFEHKMFTYSTVVCIYDAICLHKF